MENIKYKKYRHQIVFDGTWVRNWFSNMLISPIRIETNNMTFETNEHFYQSMKASNVLELNLIRTCTTPQQAKRMGAKVINPFTYLIGHGYGETIEEIKLKVMETGLRYKFELPDWREKLLTIRPTEPIIEWNNWGDVFWGVDIKNNKGENHLGRLLMQIREEYQKEINLQINEYKHT